VLAPLGVFRLGPEPCNSNSNSFVLAAAADPLLPAGKSTQISNDKPNSFAFLTMIATTPTHCRHRNKGTYAVAAKGGRSIQLVLMCPVPASPFLSAQMRIAYADCVTKLMVQ